METVELLVETLQLLSLEDFAEFRTLADAEPSLVTCSSLEAANVQDVVDLMVKSSSGECVEAVRTVLMKMDRLDLVQRLSAADSGAKDKLSVGEERLSLDQRVEKLSSDFILMLETLKDLSDEELQEFKRHLNQQKLEENEDWQETADLVDVVIFIMQTYGKESLMVTRDVLENIRMKDLVQKLSSSSASRGQHRSALIHKVATMAAVRQQLLETLDKLTHEEYFVKLKESLSDATLPEMKVTRCYTSRRIEFKPERAELVDELMEKFGRLSVKMMDKFLIKINRKDLAENLEDESSEDEYEFGCWFEISMSVEHRKLSQELQKLTWKSFEKFKSFLRFSCFEKSLPQLPKSRLDEAATPQYLAWLILKVFFYSDVWGMVRDVQTDMTEMDRWLTENGFKSQDKSSVGRKPSLDQMTEKQSSDSYLMLETLKDLSDDELETFKRLMSPYYNKSFSGNILETADLEDTVIFIMQTWGKYSVMVVRSVLKRFRRKDLVQKLSSSSASREMPLGKQSAQIHKVATMAAVNDFLLETLEDLNEPEFMELKLLLQFTRFQRNIPQIRWDKLKSADRTVIVDVLTNKYGKQSVEMIREVLLDLNRTDLALKLPETSSASKEKLSMKLNSALLQKVEKLEFVTELLLETLDELDEEELRMFWETTRRTFYHHSRYRPFWLTSFQNVRCVVAGVVLSYSHQSLEATMDVLKQMKKDDLVEKLSGRSSGPKGQHRSALSHKVATMAAVRQQLLETLDKFTKEEFVKFIGSSPTFSTILNYMSFREGVIDNIMEEFGQQSLEMIKDLLIEINRQDLAEDLQGSGESSVDEDVFLKPETPLMGITDPDQMQLETHISPAATSTEVDPSGSGSLEQDSSSWTKVDPELDASSPDQDPTYSLQSAAGHFECSVSGLRWVCRETVGFRYRFCSWDGHMERMESRGFRPAGPLLDISVLTGKVMEVQLPHWVCTDDVPELLKNFAVLHVNDCGDVLEKATRVTKTHVGLAEPVFSLLGALIHFLYSPRISCNTLIYYQPKTSYLKMRVYLIPLDPALKQSIHREESSTGYEMIKKPRPDKPLQLGQGFSLKATEETARIQPPEITLRHDSQDPNFYEVFIENPGENFNLELLQTHSEKVWFCEIRKDDHPKSGSTEAGRCSTETVTVKKEEEHFVDKHRETLIQRVRNIGPVLDGLLQRKVLQEETYNWIRSLPTSESQLREIFSCLRAADGCKDIFLSILQEKEPHLIADLQSKC